MTEKATTEEPAGAAGVDKPAPAKRNPRLWQDALKFLVGVVILAGVVLWLVPNGSALVEQIEFAPEFLLLGFLSTTVATFATSARWKLMVEAMGGTRLGYAAYFHGFVLTRVLGQFTSSLFMDLVGRGYVLRSAGSKRSIGHTTTQAVLERIYDLLLPGVMLLWALVFHGRGQPEIALWSFVAVCLVFAAAGAVALWPLSRVALAVYLRLKRWRSGDAAPASDLFATDDSPISRRDAVLVGLYSVLRYAFVVLQFWMVARAIGIVIDFQSIAEATPIGQLASIVGFTPGSLGIQEVGWAGALKWVGAEDVVIGLFVISMRVLVTLNFAVLALLSWPVARALRARHMARAAAQTAET